MALAQPPDLLVQIVWLTRYITDDPQQILV